ncbi:MAG: hypothetical protein HOY71_16570, partial [Nonomuraea sp.]|nr:hypothetical protein [Nonomuraea sp.]
MKLVRVHRGPVVVLCALTLTACLLVAGMPRALQESFDAALRIALDRATAQQIDLTVVSGGNAGIQQLGSAKEFQERENRFRAVLPAELRPWTLPPGQGTSHYSAETVNTPVTGTGGGRYINLGWLSDADKRVEWVQGRPPGPPHGKVIEIGLVQDAMDKFPVELGKTVQLGETDILTVRVVGVYKLRNKQDGYWTHNPEAAGVYEFVPPGRTEAERHTTALMAKESLTRLDSRARNVVYTWVLPINPRAASSVDLPGIRASVDEYGRRVMLATDPNTGAGYRLDTRLGEHVGDFLVAMSTGQTVMYLVLGGLLIVSLGVIALAAQLLLDRMDRTLALMRARGGSLPHVVGTGAGLVALAVAPAAVAGYALSYLVPGPVLPIVHLGPALVVATAIAFAAASVARAHRTPLHERRADVTSVRPSAKRITLEVLVVGLALVGAYLLRTRGLTSQVAVQGQDPFLLLVPVALTLAAALITLRCYPYPLKLFVRLAARRPPAVPFLGLTRAARAGIGSVLPVLVLLPALAVSVFAAVVSDGISSTQVAASWERVGVPMRVTREYEIPADFIERVKKTPGISKVILGQKGSVQVGYGSERAEILAVDVNEWRKISPVP